MANQYIEVAAASVWNDPYPSGPISEGHEGPDGEWISTTERETWRLSAIEMGLPPETSPRDIVAARVAEEIERQRLLCARECGFPDSASISDIRTALELRRQRA